MLYKIKQYLSASMLICLVACGLLFSACEKENDINVIKLDVFGPSPALRGGELRFIGTNLDKVKSIIIPNGIEVTEITKVSSNEIKITIPQNATPGIVILKTPDGEIKTKTSLTFSEPISIKSVSPKSVKAGDTFVVEGDYLNLIAKVIFSTEVAVDSTDFISQTRSKIEVKVPLAARTGKVSIANGAEIPIIVYSDDEIQVALPQITKISPKPIKPGAELTITGVDFQLVESILFAENISVTEFSVNEEKTTIKVIVPATAKEGVVKLVTFSGIEIESEELTLIAPTITSISPNPGKNGNDLTIAGTNLDLVTSVVFGGDVEGTISSRSATSIVVSIPKTATEDVVTLNTHSGKTVESPKLTLVKPTISSISPSSLMAGGEITISGSNLDLVVSVIFGGGQTVEAVVAESASILKLNVPMAAESGTITLVTVNGTEVHSTQSLTVQPADVPVITSITPTSVKPGALLTIHGTKLHLVESIYFQDNVKATQYGSRSETLIEVYVPSTAKKGNVSLKLIAFDGKEVTSPEFVISGTDPVTDPSLLIFDFENGVIGGGRWDGVGQESTADGVSGAYYEITSSNWSSGYWWVAENWMTHPSVSGKDNYVVKMDIRLRVDVPANNSEVRLMLGGNVVNILPYLLSGGNWTTGGEWKTITIPLTEWTDLSDPTPAKEGEWGIATWINGVNFTGFCVDNIRYEHK